MKSYRCYEMKNNIRAVRVEMQLTQNELATLLGTTRNTISAIETCKYMPSAYLAAMICETLKLPFEKLFFYEYEGVRAYFDFSTPTHTEQIKKLREELDWHRKYDAKIEKLTTMNPFYE